jgi:hypothetical protein
VVAFIFGLVLLVIVAIFGAFVALAYRNRRPGFSYFASGRRPRSRTRTTAASSLIKVQPASNREALCCSSIVT